MAVALSACNTDRESLPWVASMRADQYFARSCPAVGSIAETERVYFATPADAEKLGFRAATHTACDGQRALAPGPIANADDRGSAPPERGTARGTCRIAGVTDGDSVECEGGEQIRLLLIDTPELRQRPYGEQARQALLGLARPGTEVSLEYDVRRTDQFGRTLAYVWTGERMVNEEMARLGFALPLTYAPNVRHVERIRRAVEEARRERRALWSSSAFACAPRDFRAGRC